MNKLSVQFNFLVNTLNDFSYKVNRFSLKESDNRNCYALYNRHYVEILGIDLKEMLKYFNIKDFYQSNYETITVVGK